MLFAFQTPAQTGIMATLLRRALYKFDTGEAQVNPALSAQPQLQRFTHYKPTTCLLSAPFVSTVRSFSRLWQV